MKSYAEIILTFLILMIIAYCLINQEVRLDKLENCRHACIYAPEEAQK